MDELTYLETKLNENPLRDELFNIEQLIQHAIERIKYIKRLVRQSEVFSKIDFTFLYNTSKKLFSIGYNVAEQRSDAGSYDMLASEARLCSYVAIAQGQIPQDHWFSLSRLLFIIEDKPVLLS